MCGILPRMGNNLKRLRKSRGWTHERAAEMMGLSRGQLIKLERGERQLTERTIGLAAKAFGVDEADVIAEPRMVPLVGYVGAGAEAHLYSEAQGPFDEVPAPEGSTPATVAAEIRGDSLGSFFDRWLVFWDDVRDPPTNDLLGQICACGLADGRILIKKLRRGQLPGHYTLLSQVEEPIYDVILDWAARVKNMVPR